MTYDLGFNFYALTQVSLMYFSIFLLFGASFYLAVSPSLMHSLPWASVSSAALVPPLLVFFLWLSLSSVSFSSKQPLTPGVTQGKALGFFSLYTLMLGYLIHAQGFNDLLDIDNS